jgi:hypothetical protein
MISLIRGVFIEELTAGEVPSRATMQPLVRVPVQMDSVYGKFQAFEVSTTEEALPAGALETPPAEQARPPLNSATEASPRVDTRALPIIFAELDDTPSSVVPFDGPAIDADLPPLAPPGASDLKAHSLLNAAAALLIFGSVAHVASSSRGTRQNSDERVMLRSEVPRLSLRVF